MIGYNRPMETYSSNLYPTVDIGALYAGFAAPLADLDCGLKCAPHNPRQTPFCCDICQAVPAVYQQEWEYLHQATDMWHIWSGRECTDNPEDPLALRAQTPQAMLLLACTGAAHCQRPLRALSCRQFPFLPYISSDFRFLGLAYDWLFEQTCWVVSNLGAVSAAYRQEFIATFDRLFSLWPAEFNSYLQLSDELRQHYRTLNRRFVLLHRSGDFYRISPTTERRQRISPDHLPAFGPYCS